MYLQKPLTRFLPNLMLAFMITNYEKYSGILHLRNSLKYLVNANKGSNLPQEELVRFALNMVSLLSNLPAPKNIDLCSHFDPQRAQPNVHIIESR